MRIIPTRVHGILDYVIGALVVMSPWLFGFADTAGGPWLHLFIGGAILLSAAMTDFEVGMVRLIPMPVHLMLDAGIGLLALASPWLFDLTSYVGVHVALGIFEVGAALMTSTQPSRRAVNA